MFTAESAFLPWPSSSLSPPWRERQFSRGSHPFICCATVMHSLHVRTLTFCIPVTECDPSIRCQEPVRNPGHVCICVQLLPEERDVVQGRPPRHKVESFWALFQLTCSLAFSSAFPKMEPENMQWELLVSEGFLVWKTWHGLFVYTNKSISS